MCATLYDCHIFFSLVHCIFSRQIKFRTLDITEYSYCAMGWKDRLLIPCRVNFFSQNTWAAPSLFKGVKWLRRKFTHLYLPVVLRMAGAIPHGVHFTLKYDLGSKKKPTRSKLLFLLNVC